MNDKIIKELTSTDNNSRKLSHYLLFIAIFTFTSCNIVSFLSPTIFPSFSKLLTDKGVTTFLFCYFYYYQSTFFLSLLSLILFLFLIRYLFDILFTDFEIEREKFDLSCREIVYFLDMIEVLRRCYKKKSFSASESLKITNKIKKTPFTEFIFKLDNHQCFFTTKHLNEFDVSAYFYENNKIEINKALNDYFKLMNVQDKTNTVFSSSWMDTVYKLDALLIEHFSLLKKDAYNKLHITITHTLNIYAPIVIGSASLLYCIVHIILSCLNNHLPPSP